MKSPHAEESGSFEQCLARLETIVKDLEQGELSLEASLKVFEEGVSLSQRCLKILDEAERKVEILLADKNGEKRPYPFEAEGEPETGRSA